MLVTELVSKFDKLKDIKLEQSENILYILCTLPVLKELIFKYFNEPQLENISPVFTQLFVLKFDKSSEVRDKQS